MVSKYVILCKKFCSEPKVKTHILSTHLYSRPVVVPMVPYIDLFSKSTFDISSNVIPNAPEGPNFGNIAV